jgi:hypothetical protein
VAGAQVLRAGCRDGAVALEGARVEVHGAVGADVGVPELDQRAMRSSIESIDSDARG